MVLYPVIDIHNLSVYKLFSYQAESGQVVTGVFIYISPDGAMAGFEPLKGLSEFNLTEYDSDREVHVAPSISSIRYHTILQVQGVNFMESVLAGNKDIVSLQNHV